ncbi:MAG: electron transfer flavoprotein subunit beta/FixA family protein [Lentisphaerae bacterium]|nr:electron transfer flavoprotein subunit beta/FixA family protein [Lentisphaerota bacterium]MCP4103775.1 electron transfer flavoprotein subunit beta/FixA family protein [Lentisphaerota bacterium]
MSYTVLVFVKQVPDTQNITGEAMKPDGTVNRAALPAIFNPEDLNALELALQLKDRFGAKVVVGTMGPPNAAEVLRASLYRGADECILLTDRAFAGADTLATSYALSCCVKKYGEYDLILCGRQAIDGDTAQVGPQLAEKLDIPQIAYVEDVVELSNKKVVAKRRIDGGYEVLECPLPAMMTVIDANEPRPMAAKRIMKYKRARTKFELTKEHAGANYTDAEFLVEEAEKLAGKGLLINEWTAEYAGADKERIGLLGSPTKVKQIQSVVLTGGDAKNVEPSEAGVNDLIHELIEDHTLG